jgi:hypothetical protein
MKPTPLVLALSLCAARSANADDRKPACPDAVTAAVAKAYPDGAISACKHEVEDGHEQFEVRLARKAGGTLELDVAPDGKILQTEEAIDLTAVPDAVLTAFAKRYPKAKPTGAERQVQADGTTYFELSFSEKGKKRAATFSLHGKFVEEE